MSIRFRTSLLIQDFSNIHRHFCRVVRTMIDDEVITSNREEICTQKKSELTKRTVSDIFFSTTQEFYNLHIRSYILHVLLHCTQQYKSTCPST